MGTTRSQRTRTHKAAAMAEAQRGTPVFTFDLVLYVLRHTLLSPVFAAGIALFLHHGQKHTLEITFFDARFALAYFATCWFLWFVPFSSRVWRNHSWKWGLQGIAGMHRIDWSDQIVLVTGGRSGVGKAIVDVLDLKKVTVVVLDRTLPDSGETDYNDTHFYQCDVSDYEQVARVAETIKKEVGNPTVIINNAGTVVGKSLVDLSASEIQKTMNVNAVAPFFVIKAFLPEMLQAKAGHIVNVSSILGQLGVAHCTDYCASKYAVVGLHDALEGELLRHHKCRTVCLTLVLPCFIRTQLFAAIKPFSPLNAFLLPTLEPYQVAQAIVSQVEKEESAVLGLPALTNITWLWRGFPSWAQDAIKWLSEADSAMADFHHKNA